MLFLIAFFAGSMKLWHLLGSVPLWRVYSLSTPSSEQENIY